MTRGFDLVLERRKICAPFCFNRWSFRKKPISGDRNIVSGFLAARHQGGSNTIDRDANLKVKYVAN
jgi:hypothetical protein